jgi:polyhydroxyalkanoate synthesis regulator phasin
MGIGSLAARAVTGGGGTMGELQDAVDGMMNQALINGEGVVRRENKTGLQAEVERLRWRIQGLQDGLNEVVRRLEAEDG